MSLSHKDPLHSITLKDSLLGLKPSAILPFWLEVAKRVVTFPSAPLLPFSCTEARLCRCSSLDPHQKSW